MCVLQSIETVYPNASAATNKEYWAVGHTLRARSRLDWRTQQLDLLLTAPASHAPLTPHGVTRSRILTSSLSLQAPHNTHDYVNTDGQSKTAWLAGGRTCR